MVFKDFSKKILNYFTDILILIIYVPSFPILPATSVLDLNKALLLLSAGKSAIAPLAHKNGSSL